VAVLEEGVRGMAEDPDKRRVVPASEILGKLQKGEPVEYYDVIIEGDLDLGKLDQPTHKERTELQKVFGLSEEVKLIKSPIRINESEIKGLLDFKNAVFKEKIEFMGSKFDLEADLKGSQFIKDVSFANSQFGAKVSFSESNFEKGADFNDAIFKENVTFSDSRFKSTYFKFVDFGGRAHFSGCKFRGNADFTKSKFCNDADFRMTKVVGDAYFLDAQFQGRSAFMGLRFKGIANFRRAVFKGKSLFFGSEFSGNILTFRDATFLDPKSQEDACRRAKIVSERVGDREEAGYYFYREMEAKRMQKPWYYRYPEFLLIQKVFGYGVHPLWLWAWWFGFVGLFAVIYWLGTGIDATASGINGTAQLRDYIWFSIATAVTPGYAGYKPIPEFKLVAGLEAILGTFMWAAFIATFARKYMK
jgi:uncharacterized protein YjbI with pentapeptide repeats